MSALVYRLPPELEKRLHATRADHVQPQANAFMHDGKLNMGPAILLATVLSIGCWGILISVGLRLFH
jgi:hypothetical protein